ncbi:MAG: D-alanyl-D-alanine carboxypeptidase family protein [Methylocystis sp.]
MTFFLRSFSLFLIFASALGLNPASAQSLQISAPNAILIDASTNSVLFEKDADALVPPASTVKILTAEMIFHDLSAGKLKLDDEYVVSEYAWRNGGGPAGGTAMFLPLKSSTRIEDLLRGLLVQSGNDAALVLAEGSAGSEETFVLRMNKRANELGLTKSRFGSPWGKFSEDQKVTAREMAKLAAYIIKTYPNYYPYFGEKEFTWNKIRQQNRNPLLTMSLGADGLMTGALEKGDFGLVASAVQEGRRLIVAVYGAKTAKERAEDAQKLLQWGFRNFEEKELFKAGEIIGPAQIYGGVKGSVDLASKTDVKALLPHGGTEKLSGKIVYEGPVSAPITAGAPIGRLVIKRGSAVILEQPLEATESIAQGSLSGRTFDALYEMIAGAIHQKIADKFSGKK